MSVGAASRISGWGSRMPIVIGALARNSELFESRLDTIQAAATAAVPAIIAAALAPPKPRTAPPTIVRR